MQFQFKNMDDATLTANALRAAADLYEHDAKVSAADINSPPPLRDSLEKQFRKQATDARRIADEIDARI